VFNSFSSANPELILRYVLEERQGLSNARNRGIAVSKHEVITFIDDDVLLSQDFIIEIDKAFKSLPDADIIGGQVILKYPTKKPKWLNENLEQYLSKMDYGNEIKSIDFQENWLVGANISFRRKALIKNKFNPNLGRVGNNLISGEETELCCKILNEGGKAYYYPLISLQHIITPDRIEKQFFKRRFFSGGISTGIAAKINSNTEFRSKACLDILRHFVLMSVSLFGSKRFHIFLLLKEDFGKLKGYNNK
jgi:glycosyltransferase involved in cell wall biosynthesis